MLGLIFESFVSSELKEISSQKRSALGRGVHSGDRAITFLYAFKTYNSSSTLGKVISL